MALDPKEVPPLDEYIETFVFGTFFYVCCSWWTMFLPFVFFWNWLMSVVIVFALLSWRYWLTKWYIVIFKPTYVNRQGVIRNPR